MNRREEYAKLLRELEQPAPALDDTVQRAAAKRKKRNWVVKPLTSFAILCLTFVLAVNLSAPIADACSRIPLLKDLARVVTFSNSLSEAVENEYVQPINLKESKNGITVSVDYLIVDQKQVNIFFRVDAENYSHLAIDPKITKADGGFLACSYSLNDWDAENGELQSMTVDFVNEDVPESMEMILKLYDEDAHRDTAVEDSEFPDATYNQPPYLAVFQFQLNFDSAFTATGKKISVDKTVMLDGQKVTFTDIEIYPTHMRIDIKSDESNTAWLADLDLYILADDNKEFKPASDGTRATGSTESMEMDSYYCDSAYFHKAEKLTIVVTGAHWLDKGHYRYHVNLRTGKSEKLPYGIKILSTKQKENRWKIKFDNTAVPAEDWISHICDSNGKTYDINLWDSLGNVYFEDYPEKEAWIVPYYNRQWRPDSPVKVEIN